MLKHRPAKVAAHRMPKRTDIESILIIGAGPIVIGQACEFDYSGAQACKALRAEGYRVILVNSNPATIMTDPGTGRCHLRRADHAGHGRAHHRPGEARCAAADDGRTDGTQCRDEACRVRRAGEIRRGADRRKRRSDRAGRGPPEIPRRDGGDRPRKPENRDRANTGRSPRGAVASSGFPPSSARASRSAAPAAASPTTARNSSRSSRAAWTRRPPPKC